MFARRRQRFLDAMGPDSVGIVVGARLMTRSNDTEFPFRQDSDFWYLTGFNHPNAVAVFRTDGGPAFTLFVEPRDAALEVWTGYRPGLDGAKREWGADEAYEIGALAKELPQIVEKARHLHHTLGRDSALDTQLVSLQEMARQRTKLGVYPAEELRDPRAIVHEMRLYKEEQEIALMREAADISREAHSETSRLIVGEGARFEYELEATLNYVFRRRGGSGPAYNSIVAGGKNAAILHYVTNDQPLTTGELVLIDAGAEYKGYASDVTRTYPIGGRYEGAGRAVYEVVLASQDAALAAALPGTTLPDVHQVALRVLCEGMVSLGLLSGDVEQIMKDETYKPYYMHGTSHWLGLDVHDCGAYSRDGTPRPLEPGMAFTVEPGLYIAHDASDAPEALRGIGVRIEDDVVVTPDGVENLNAAIPKRIDDVEAWMRA